MVFGTHTISVRVFRCQVRLIDAPTPPRLLADRHGREQDEAPQLSLLHPPHLFVGEGAAGEAAPSPGKVVTGTFRLVRRICGFIRPMAARHRRVDVQGTLGAWRWSLGA